VDEPALNDLPNLSQLLAYKLRTNGQSPAYISARRLKRNMRNPWLAGILSFLIPGLGQIYNGRILFGIIWLLVFGVSWIGSAGILGWIVHIISAWCAYSYAKDHPVRV